MLFSLNWTLWVSIDFSTVTHSLSTTTVFYILLVFLCFLILSPMSPILSISFPSTVPLGSILSILQEKIVLHKRPIPTQIGWHSWSVILQGGSGLSILCHSHGWSVIANAPQSHVSAPLIFSFFGLLLNPVFHHTLVVLISVEKSEHFVLLASYCISSVGVVRRNIDGFLLLSGLLMSENRLLWSCLFTKNVCVNWGLLCVRRSRWSACLSFILICLPLRLLSIFEILKLIDHAEFFKLNLLTSDKATTNDKVSLIFFFRLFNLRSSCRLALLSVCSSLAKSDSTQIV